ncbi:MAG TPA: metallophosphoesterase [Syntrophorhabdaceae bacterium]|nr:metallophosphoesterase [Syntrophorhabdaceae bacterium]
MTFRYIRPVILFVFILLILVSSKSFRETDVAFAVISDTHVGAATSKYVPLMYLLKREGVRHVLHAGDAIYHPGEIHEWKKFVAGLYPQQVMHLAPGNHDIRDDASLREYLKVFSSGYSSFSDGDVLFVLLNSEIPGQNGIKGDQFLWLEAELKRPFRYKFVFMHRPYYSSTRPDSVLENGNATMLHSLFVNTGVSLVVAGHYHAYMRSTRDGITYLSMSPGHYRNIFWEFSTSGEPGYLVAVRNNRGFLFTLKDLYGGIMDEFSIVR